MKATGIVRRIDDLGRIVIPKEIRRTQRIRESDPMEIYTSREGEIMLRKYSPIGELGQYAADYANSLSEATGYTACVTDRDICISAAGKRKKDIEGKELSSEVEELIERRKIVGYDFGEEPLSMTQDVDDLWPCFALASIISGGDVIGAVALMDSQEDKWDTDQALTLVKTAAKFIGRQME